MQTAEKIANLLLSDEQANKDLAFALMEGQGVDFDEVLELVRGTLIWNVDKLEAKKAITLVIYTYKLEINFNKDRNCLVAYIYKLTEIKSNRGVYYWTVIHHSTYSNDIVLDYIDIFLTKVKLKYHETRQSNHHNQ